MQAEGVPRLYPVRPVLEEVFAVNKREREKTQGDDREERSSAGSSGTHREGKEEREAKRVRMDGSEGEQDPEDMPEEAAKPKALRKPTEPTAEERRQHEIGHLPYRSWCPACVKGRKKDRDHHPRPEEDRSIRSLHLDFFFLGDGDAVGEEASTYPCVLMKERESKMCFAYMVPSRGMDQEWAVKQLAKDIEYMGIAEGPLMFKGDQEPAIETFINKLKVVSARGNG